MQGMPREYARAYHSEKWERKHIELPKKKENQQWTFSDDFTFHVHHWTLRTSSDSSQDAFGLLMLGFLVDVTATKQNSPVIQQGSAVICWWVSQEGR